MEKESSRRFDIDAVVELPTMDHDEPADDYNDDMPIDDFTGNDDDPLPNTGSMSFLITSS